MEITRRNEFAADPATVAAMLMDKGFLERVCEASGANSYEVTINGNRITRKRAMPTPSAAAKFVKGDIVVIEDTTWTEAEADGSRTGTLVGGAEGISFLDVNGQARLYPGGKGTIVDYSGEMKINIPFMGKKLEQQAAPVLQEAMAIEEQVGAQWLAEHA